jgi:hypothetical protein
VKKAASVAAFLLRGAKKRRRTRARKIVNFNSDIVKR